MISGALKSAEVRSNRGLLGVMCAIFALYMFSLAFNNPNTVVSLWIPVIACFLIGLGGALVHPSVYSAITNLAPAKIQGTLFGVNIFSLALAGKVSGMLGVMLVTPSGHIDLGRMSSTYLWMLAGFAILLLVSNRNKIFEKKYLEQP